MLYPFLTFLLSLLLSLALVPLVRRISLRAGRTVPPRPDRWHRQPTPALGGLAICAACLLALGVAAFFAGGLGQVRWGLLGGSLLVFLVGLYDDLRPLAPPTKLIGQILAAAIAVALGYSTQFFTPRLPGNPLAQIPNLVLTFAWLVAITNAFNLLDNMDGLAAGVAVIAAAILSFFFWKLDNQGLLLISLALAGSALGFLVFNFPPARIFMGDSGSLFLGFTLAVLAIARQPQASNVFAVMGVPTLLFLLPILDTALVTITRLLRGQSPTQGGRDHASHRLVAFGLNERQAVLALYAVALVSGVLAALLESLAYWFSLVVVPALVISLALISAYLGGLKVVASPALPNQRGFFTRAVMELTYRRRILEILLDFFVIGITLYLAMLTRFRLVPGLLELYGQLLPLALANAYLALFLAGVYRGVWRYLEIGDLGRYFLASMGGTILTALAARAVYGSMEFSASLAGAFGVYLFLGLAASRSSFQLLDLLSRRQRRKREGQCGREQRVLVYGAGDAGELALRWMLMNPQLAYTPVGFLDEDPYLAGRRIHGVAVLGGAEALEEILERRQVDGLILTPGLPDGDVLLTGLLSACQKSGCWVRRLRLEFESVEENEGQGLNHKDTKEDWKVGSSED